MDKISDEELDMLIDLNQDKYCQNHYDFTVQKAANELKELRDLNIVHCKDCKHWGTGVAGETENVKCCEYGKYMVGANGYCVYGEKECAE